MQQTASPAPIRFIVIGFGHIGKRHALCIDQDHEAELVALCDIRPQHEVLAGTAWAEYPFYQSVKDLLESKVDFDIACICVPNGLHAEVALPILEAGKHVVIEKPIVLNPANGERLRQASRAYGGRIYGVLQNRYTPTAQWLKQTIDSGALGQIYNVQMHCLWNRDERYYTPGGWHGNAELDGGTLYTQYSHFIDLLIWTLGPIEIEQVRLWDYAHASLSDFEDSGSVHFRTQQGADGHLFYSTAVYGRNMEVSLTLLAEHGAIRLSGAYLNELEHVEIRGLEPPTLPPSAQGNQYGGYSGSAQNHHHVIRHIVADLKGQPASTTTLDEGLAVVNTIQKIYSWGS